MVLILSNTKAIITEILSPPELHFGRWWVEVCVTLDDGSTSYTTSIDRIYLWQANNIKVGDKTIISI
ncbi:hypothetical protein NVP1101O_025 [Vibrio phage 1.101.O._10N.261.45.C6]|nr:hypothetical protein NVP1101O_025 [Vibrio phage 1.101.O._10N.261.45.C6]